VLISAPHRRSAWFAGIRAAFDGMGAGLFPQFRESPLYAGWRAVTPDESTFPALMDATGELLRQPYDWSSAVMGLPMPLLLVFGDADSIAPAHVAEFFGLLGGGRRRGWRSCPGQRITPCWRRLRCLRSWRTSCGYRAKRSLVRSGGGEDFECPFLFGNFERFRKGRIPRSPPFASTRRATVADVTDVAK
jgi:hypothetical protein